MCSHSGQAGFYDRVHSTGEVAFEAIDFQQVAIDARRDEVHRASRRRGDGGHSGGVRFLDRLAEGLKLTGMNKHIEARIRLWQVVAIHAAGEHGGGQFLPQQALIGAIAHHNQLHVFPVVEGTQAGD